MKMNKVVIAAAIALVAVSAVLFFAYKPVRAEDDGSTAMSHSPAKPSNDNSAAILQKLDEVSNGQRAILEGIEALKREINVVKIRVTQQQ